MRDLGNDKAFAGMTDWDAGMTAARGLRYILFEHTIIL